MEQKEAWVTYGPLDRDLALRAWCAGARAARTAFFPEALEGLVEAGLAIDELVNRARDAAWERHRAAGGHGPGPYCPVLFTVDDTVLYWDAGTPVALSTTDEDEWWVKVPLLSVVRRGAIECSLTGRAAAVSEVGIELETRQSVGMGGGPVMIYSTK